MLLCFSLSLTFSSLCFLICFANLFPHRIEYCLSLVSIQGLLAIVCNCWGFTLQILGGSDVVVDFVLKEEVVYVPAPTLGRGIK